MNGTQLQIYRTVLWDTTSAAKTSFRFIHTAALCSLKSQVDTDEKKKKHPSVSSCVKLEAHGPDPAHHIVLCDPY